nr:unnamed protein product [Callosobruchus analis]
MSRRVDGYPYRLSFTMAELGIRNPNGFILKDLYQKDAPLKEINDSEPIVIRIKPSGVYSTIILRNLIILVFKCFRLYLSSLILRSSAFILSPNIDEIGVTCN